MLKTILMTVLLTLLLIPVAGLAAKDATPAYDSYRKYDGLYKPERLYQLDIRNDTWLGSISPATWSDLPCREAVNAFRKDGTWTGNFSDDGKCLGSAEAPTYASGNYLNFLNQTLEAEKKTGDKDKD